LEHVETINKIGSVNSTRVVSKSWRAKSIEIQCVLLCHSMSPSISLYRIVIKYLRQTRWAVAMARHWAVGPAGSEWRCARANLSLSSCPAFAGLFWGELDIGFTHWGVMVSGKCEWCHRRRLMSWVTCQ
jgi:hypothetical protein